MPFMRLRKFLSISSILNASFHQINVLNFTKCFFWVFPSTDNHVDFVLYLLIWCLRFSTVNPTLQSWTKSHLVIVYIIFFIYCCILFWYSVSILHLFSQELFCSFLLVISLSGFSSRVIVVLRMFWKVIPAFLCLFLVEGRVCKMVIIL